VLGIIFASGNIPAGHEVFESDHICNKFCKFFQLPVDYKAWATAEIANNLFLPSSTRVSGQKGVDKSPMTKITDKTRGISQSVPMSLSKQT
jgi:hypothetical protein